MLFVLPLQGILALLLRSILLNMAYCDFIRRVLFKDHVNDLLKSEYHLIEKEAFDQLINSNGSEYTISHWQRPFDDVLVALPIADAALLHVDEKVLVAPKAVLQQGSQFIVYGAGINRIEEAGFELSLGKMGVSVFGFDCTMSNATVLPNVTFRNWCIGKRAGFENNVYSTRMETDRVQFYSLSEIKHHFHHKHIHVLKMDIEGFEWDILKDIVNNPVNEDLPEQLLFELHTEGADRQYVPAPVVKDRNRAQVNQLFIGLWRRGYRVVAKTINPGDAHCADFSLLRVHKHDLVHNITLH